MLIVTKPYMERRALRTFEAQWTLARRDGSRPHIYIASWRTSLADYVSDSEPFDDVVNIMVGDLERIKDYPRRGFMTPSVVPRAVIEAYEVLIRAGFTQHSLQ